MDNYTEKEDKTRRERLSPKDVYNNEEEMRLEEIHFPYEDVCDSPNCGNTQSHRVTQK